MRMLIYPVGRDMGKYPGDDIKIRRRKYEKNKTSYIAFPLFEEEEQISRFESLNMLHYFKQWTGKKQHVKSKVMP